MNASGLSTAKAFDYVSIREAYAGMQPKVLSERGMPCSGATSAPCLAKTTQTIEPFVETICVQACVEYSLLTTRGDTVEKWATPEDAVMVLETIDTPDDALMLVTTHGYSVHCPNKRIPNYPERALPSVTPLPTGGYEVVATRVTRQCPVVLERFRLRVLSTGEVSVLEHEDLMWKGTCA